MSVVVEVIIAVAILAFIVLILNCGVEERYTYEEYEDENGNIVEKVFDHKDKGEN